MVRQTGNMALTATLNGLFNLFINGPILVSAGLDAFLTEGRYIPGHQASAAYIIIGTMQALTALAVLSGGEPYTTLLRYRI